MTHYIAAPTLADWRTGPDAENYIPRTVHEREPDAPAFSGIYNADGQKLYRVSSPKRIGFVHYDGNAA